MGSKGGGDFVPIVGHRAFFSILRLSIDPDVVVVGGVVVLRSYLVVWSSRRRECNVSLELSLRRRDVILDRFVVM